MSYYSDSVYSQDGTAERLPTPGRGGDRYGAQPQASARSFPSVGGHGQYAGRPQAVARSPSPVVGYDPYAIAAQQPFSRPLPRVRRRDQNVGRPQAADRRYAPASSAASQSYYQPIPDRHGPASYEGYGNFQGGASGASRDYAGAEEIDSRASIRTEYGPGPDSCVIPSPQPEVTYEQETAGYNFGTNQHAAMSHPTRRVPFDEQGSSPLQFEAFQHEEPYPDGSYEDQGRSFGGRSARGPLTHSPLTSHPTRRMTSHEQATSPLQNEALQDQSGSLGSRSVRGPLPHIPLIPSVRLASLPKFPTPPGPVVQPFGAGGTGGIPLTLPRKHEYTVRNVSDPSSVVKVTNVQATGEPAGPALGDLAEISGLAEKVISALDNDSSFGTFGNKVKQWLGDVPSFVDCFQDVVEKTKSAEKSLKHDENYYANLEDFRIRSMSNSAFEALLDMMRKVEVVIGDDKSLARKTRSKIIKGLGELHYSLERLTAKIEGILGEEVQKSRYVLNKIKACRQNLKVQNQ
ncbi:uncharacterized protein L3040_007734 [Drepanopeziza brunnea f. sp. 'multigermtubi']|uniref:Uncharacterized protein n=1 Tax=Marssonina brunnea f. sp. multigermtubi (strain MB_m1) TaxID=1072389 RepID=K1WK75_MARBU|nr:uncharacterized protein MBM_03857 [Drepanopeziza brunnea f. sp. 'multigermtubi' MB_m1]EKD18085.1 hypothetical protein MBM_03857 [Drepanopeziza brunnea f. sp. 'multigermtubi' MB_m1]KAJ5037562.1 hypothetical protein L3040_007734 [Drepanopeziza brunnea f. sp. 'multigermtubi']